MRCLKHLTWTIPLALLIGTFQLGANEEDYTLWSVDGVAVLLLVSITSGLIMATLAWLFYGREDKMTSTMEYKPSGISVYDPASKTLRLSDGSEHDFYCGKELNDKAQTLIRLVNGDIAIQEAYRVAEASKPGEEPEYAETKEASHIQDKFQEASEDQKRAHEAKAKLDNLESELKDKKEELEELQKEIEALEPRVEKGRTVVKHLESQLVGFDELNEQVNEIYDNNEKAAKWEAWNLRNKEYEEAKEEHKSFDDMVKGLREQKEEALDNAEWPLDGLSIEDGDILYNGVLLSNLGESEQMLVCAALAMEDIKKHPVRVVRMDGVESMGKEDFGKLQELFNNNDVQVLSSRVSRGDVDEGEIEIVEGEYTE